MTWVFFVVFNTTLKMFWELRPQGVSSSFTQQNLPKQSLSYIGVPLGLTLLLVNLFDFLIQRRPNEIWHNSVKLVDFNGSEYQFWMVICYIMLYKPMCYIYIYIIALLNSVISHNIRLYATKLVVYISTFRPTNQRAATNITGWLRGRHLQTWWLNHRALQSNIPSLKSIP